MNALGLSATFGILVLIFQDGRFESLLGYQSQGGLESTQPLLLFAVAFGLSTDYGVFLLSRIKEAHDGGYDDREAVAVGLERTGRIVTAAALLFSIAIGAFVTSQVIFIKELGLGTAIAVLIDATIIRALLVPSLMQLLGKWNWWAPRRCAACTSGSGSARPRADRARAAGEGAAEGDLVGVLEVGADRQAGGQPGDRDLAAQQLGDVVGGRLAGRRRVGGEHDLGDLLGAATRATSSAIFRSSGSTPSIGDSAPPSTW